MLRIFVYGTLKPGFHNYLRYCAGRTSQEQLAIVTGTLYALPVGYPGLTVGNRWVKGYLLSFPDRAASQMLTQLDQLEGYSADQPSHLNEYERRLTDVFTPTRQFLAQAWCYYMDRATVQRMGGTLISDGEWLERVDS